MSGFFYVNILKENFLFERYSLTLVRDLEYKRRKTL